MVVCRQCNGNGLETEWYMKPIASVRTLNYNSIHPLTVKVSTAIGFIDRVNRLTSNKNIKEKRKIVLDYLVKNDYPKSLVNRLFNHNVTRSYYSLYQWI